MYKLNLYESGKFEVIKTILSDSVISPNKARILTRIHEMRLNKTLNYVIFKLKE